MRIRKEPRHHHRWVEVRRQSFPPTHSPTHFDSVSAPWSDDIKAMIFGYTVVELKCTDCGDVTTRRLD